MKSKLYEFRFNGLYLGGKAIVKAINEDAAWKALRVFVKCSKKECCSTKIDS